MLLRDQIADRGLTYACTDGAGGEKDYTSDFTVMQVWSTQPDESIVLLDAVRDRLDPMERIEAAIALYQRWGQYRFQSWRWETYGMDSDTFWLKKYQTDTSNYFTVIPVAGTRKNAKHKRITGRVFPAFKQRKIVLPETLLIECKYLGGGSLDYVQHLLGMAVSYPQVEYDDDLDCLSRMFEPDHPLLYPERPRSRERRGLWDDDGERARQPDVYAPWRVAELG